MVINAWELLLKAYIAKYLPKVKLFLNDDGTTKPFNESLACVASNSSNEFQIIKENLDHLYKYRNNFIHFYLEDIDVIIFSLLKSSVIFFVDFLRENFKVDLTEENGLVLLPIGFKKPYSPVDFLSNKSVISNNSPAVKSFIGSIVNSSKKLKALDIDESILVDYRISLINEKRIKNADIIAGISGNPDAENIIVVQNSLSDVVISNDPSAKKIRVTEESLYDDIYTESYRTVTTKSREIFSGFVQGKEFNRIMKNIKQDPSLHKKRYLDPSSSKGSNRSWYSKAIYDELAKHFMLKSNNSE